MSWRQILGAEKREIEPIGKHPQYPQNPTGVGNSEDCEDIEDKDAESESCPKQSPEGSPTLRLAITEFERQNLTFTEFVRQNIAIALRVPWMKGELWLAQDEEAATELIAEGVSRGRIFHV